jgi:hypothetical protein
MKNLQDFKQKPTILEEKSDYSKFDMLVRAGLANKSQLARLHRVLDKMKEDRPVFNPMERNLVQGLFNKMIDLITTNKMIFQQTRRTVREETEELDVIEAEDLQEQKQDKMKDPPFVLMLKRKAIRLYPNNTKIALYYNQKLNKYFSVPYGAKVDGPLQAEETVMNQLKEMVDNRRSGVIKFANGQAQKVDYHTASAITQVFESVNGDNKNKLLEMVHTSPAHFTKVADFALSKIK